MRVWEVWWWWSCGRLLILRDEDVVIVLASRGLELVRARRQRGKGVWERWRGGVLWQLLDDLKEDVLFGELLVRNDAAEGVFQGYVGWCRLALGLRCCLATSPQTN